MDLSADPASRRLDISVDRDSDAAGTSPVSAYAGTRG